MRRMADFNSQNIWSRSKWPQSSWLGSSLIAKGLKWLGMFKIPWNCLAARIQDTSTSSVRLPCLSKTTDIVTGPQRLRDPCLNMLPANSSILLASSASSATGMIRISLGLSKSFSNWMVGLAKCLTITNNILWQQPLMTNVLPINQGLQCRLTINKH